MNKANPEYNANTRTAGILDKPPVTETDMIKIDCNKMYIITYVKMYINKEK